MNKLDLQQESEETIEYGTSLKAILAKDIPENSYLHLKDDCGVYYIFHVTAKAGNFIYINCVFGPRGAQNKSGLIHDKILAVNKTVKLGIEEPSQDDEIYRKIRETGPLRELVISKGAVPLLLSGPIIYNNPVRFFYADMLPSDSIAIEVDTKSGKKYTIKVLTINEQGNIFVSVEGEGSLNGVVGRLKSMILGEGFRISIRDGNTNKYAYTSKVTKMQFVPVVKSKVDAVLHMLKDQNEIGQLD